MPTRSSRMSARNGWESTASWSGVIRSRDGRDRSVLNAMLADVASSGVFVSAHPEVIGKMGTKEVLYRTREMSWAAIPAFTLRWRRCGRSCRQSWRLCPRVLKQIRGHSGDGVWKVQLADRLGPTAGDGLPSRHGFACSARQAGQRRETMSLGDSTSLCAPYSAGAEA